MKFITLTNSKKRCIVDDEDYDNLVIMGTWRILRGYATHSKHNGYVNMARFLLNAPKGLQIDHINRDKLDNRKANLRLCTPQQNSFNVGKHCDNTSGYKGVTWNKSVGKWQAQSTQNKHTNYLGVHLNKEDAYYAYCRFIVARGEYATK